MNDTEIISYAMKLLGHRGGKSKSALKSDVARLNGARKYMKPSVYREKLGEIQRRHRKEGIVELTAKQNGIPT